MEIFIGFVLGFGVTLCVVFYIANKNSNAVKDTNSRSIELMSERNILDGQKVEQLKRIADALENKQ